MRHLKCPGAFEPLELLFVEKREVLNAFINYRTILGVDLRCSAHDQGGILRGGCSHEGTARKRLGFQECCRKNLALMNF